MNLFPVFEVAPRSDYDTPHYACGLKCEASTNETGNGSDEPQDA